MNEIQAAIQFILAIEILGLIGWPLAKLLFARFPDHGWGFGKIIGLLTIGWLMWLLSSLKILPFNLNNLIFVAVIIGLINWAILYRLKAGYFKGFLRNSNRIKNLLVLIALEELIFLCSFAIWTYLRGFSPDINGLEKFMDYGFMLSILKTKYFPPLDHFLARETINYYYFGHYIAALMTLLARVPAALAYNLQMSLLFALILMESFSIGAGFFFISNKNENQRLPWRSWLSGMFVAIFIGLIGNLHAIIYYPNDAEAYWYPNATRFIENTIHEFPIYSFIVNDLHGHVSNIPNVLLIIGLLFVYLLQYTPKFTENQNNPSILLPQLSILIPLSFFIGAAYPTNAWDFAIYLFLSGMIIWTVQTIRFKAKKTFRQTFFQFDVIFYTSLYSLLLLGLAMLWFLPAWKTIVPISQGIGLVPFDKRSPLWQLGVLWGIQLPLALFFVVWVFKRVFQRHSVSEMLLTAIAKILNVKMHIKTHRTDKPNSHHLNEPKQSTIRIGNLNIHLVHLFLILLTLLAIFLIILPEFIFIRDIYPTHFRANTMFKFFYQAWIMLGIVCGCCITMLWQYFNRKRNFFGQIFKTISLLLIFSGLLYGTLAVSQGFNGLKDHKQSIQGTNYLASKFPGDFEAIEWLNQNISDQPTLVEAVGESYTDFARISANTGIPTVLGWPVHEWLWRGSYLDPLRPETKVQKKTGGADTVASRVEDVRAFYETNDPQTAQGVIEKYGIEYIYVGQMEREKYPNLNEKKYRQMNLEIVYDKNDSRIYYVQ